MTDNKLEEILTRTLGQEIDEQDIYLYETALKENEYTQSKQNNWIIKAGLSVALFAIIISAVTGTSFFTDKKPDQIITQNNIQEENPFKITVNAAELSDKQSIPLFSDGTSKHGAVAHGGEDKESIYYHISTDLGCNGQNIKTITYRINKGAFCIQELRKNECIVDYKPVDIADIDDDEVKSKYDLHTAFITPTEDMEGFDMPGTEFVCNRMPRKSTKYYASEYTVNYEAQTNATTLIGIYGFTKDKLLYEKFFSEDEDVQDRDLAWSELMKDIEIECIVTYENGHKKGETIGFESDEFPTIDECDSLSWNLDIKYVLKNTEAPEKNAWANKDADRIIFSNGSVKISKGDFLKEIINNIEAGKSKEEVVNNSVINIVSQSYLSQNSGTEGISASEAYEKALGVIAGRDEINIKLIAEWLYDKYFNELNTNL